MKRNVSVFLMVFFNVFVLSLVSYASDASNEIEQLKLQTEMLQQQFKQLESQQAENTRVLQSEKETIPDWIKKIDVSGDILFQHESVDTESASEKNRERLRVRLNLSTQINDNIDACLRFSTSEGNPRRNDVDFGGGLSNKDFELNRAFINWQTNESSGFKITLGKMDIPFYQPGGSQLVFDSDLGFEGAAFDYSTPAFSDKQLFVHSGFFDISDSFGTSPSDQYLYGVQAGLESDSKPLNWTTGFSYYDFCNFEDEQVLDWEDKNRSFGNSAINNRYKHDYNVLQYFVNIKTKLGEVPFSVYGDYITNIASGVSEDTGLLFGVAYNSTEDPGSWQLGYEWRDLDADATLGAFTDIAFLCSGTGGTGHMLSFKYKVQKNCLTNVAYFMSETDNNTEINHLLVNLIFIF